MLGYYDDGVNEQCQQCDIKCKACTNSTSSDCQSCISPYYHLLTTCYQTCPSGYYGNATSQLCLNCGSYCQICTDSMTCLQCNPTYFIQAAVCVAICSDGYYPDSVLAISTCSACATNCSTCISLTNCTKCNTGFYLYATSCYPCNPACNGCTGPGSNQCKSCYYPLFLNISTCISISCAADQYVDPINGCRGCGQLFSQSNRCNTTNAFSCEGGYKLTNNQTCTVCSSIVGYYVDSSQTCS